MHKYLKAIGFSMPDNNKDLQILVRDVLKNYDRKRVVETESGRHFAEFSKEFARDCGIKICGEYNDEDEFRMEYYFPYLNGLVISSSEDVIIERQTDRESYLGACDDMRIDITLIFHVINSGEYLEIKSREHKAPKTSSVCLSALSTEGKILLPVERSKNYHQERQKKVRKRTALIMAARNGDEAAMESLTVEDMDNFDMAAKRIKNEDLYSIIDNCFMPYGLGTDMYSIIGDIQDVSYESNSYTGEELCKLGIMCNGIAMDVCINTKDLVGEPAEGRRFKGVIWLQGSVQF